MKRKAPEVAAPANPDSPSRRTRRKVTIKDEATNGVTSTGVVEVQVTAPLPGPNKSRAHKGVKTEAGSGDDTNPSPQAASPSTRKTAGTESTTASSARSQRKAKSPRQRLDEAETGATGITADEPRAVGSRKRKIPQPSASIPAAADEQPTRPEADDVATKKSKPKKLKIDEATMPLAARTANTALRLGAHGALLQLPFFPSSKSYEFLTLTPLVSASGGAHNAITNAVHIGANAFALFLKSQRKWENPPLHDDVAAAWTSGCAKHTYDAGKHCVPHGSYLVNLAVATQERADQAYKSFLDDLQRCERLGIRLYNFHPGNTNGEPRPQAIARLAAQINKAHQATSSVIVLLENMAAGKTANTIGGSFEDLRDVIALVTDKSRVGVCLDTCHAFAAGYDLRTAEALKATLKEFDDVIGIKYLMACHLNDSKGVFGSNRDLHQNIGLGFLGLRAFHALVNEPVFHGIPLILETPSEKKDENGKTVEDKSVWSTEIKLLESLVGMELDDDFGKLEAGLQAKGSDEREKLAAQFEKKRMEAEKPKKRRGKIGKNETTDDEVE